MKGSTHWMLERAVSVALLPALSIGIYSPNMICNGLLAMLLPLHCHWGIEQVITDYLPARRAGTFVNGLAKALLYAGTGLTVFGLFRYNTNDLGIGEGIKLIWKGPSKDQ